MTATATRYVGAVCVYCGHPIRFHHDSGVCGYRPDDAPACDCTPDRVTRAAESPTVLSRFYAEEGETQ